MIATVIVDNTASGGLAGEWGLCILVEQAGKKILLDTGGVGFVRKEYAAARIRYFGY